MLHVVHIKEMERHVQHTRARRIITRGPIRVVGIFPSTKSDRTLHWESQLERDRMYQHEIDPHVRSFREQPKTYELLVDGVVRRYTPDLEIAFHSGAVVIEEIKPAARVSQEARLYQAMAAALENDGIKFRVVTDTEIRRQPYLQNIKYLLPEPTKGSNIEVIDRSFSRIRSMSSPCISGTIIAGYCINA